MIQLRCYCLLLVRAKVNEIEVFTSSMWYLTVRLLEWVSNYKLSSCLCSTEYWVEFFTWIILCLIVCWMWITYTFVYTAVCGKYIPPSLHMLYKNLDTDTYCVVADWHGHIIITNQNFFWCFGFSNFVCLLCQNKLFSLFFAVFKTSPKNFILHCHFWALKCKKILSVITDVWSRTVDWRRVISCWKLTAGVLLALLKNSM